MSEGVAEAPATVKVLLLGDPFVGKTSLRSQFIHHVFSNSYRATVGADYLSKKVVLEGSGAEVLLQIWDTAGQERFSSLIKNFYRGTDVAVFVYDVTKPSSFHNLINWITQFIENVRVAKPTILLVGNKCDKPMSEHLISLRQCKEWILSSENYIDQYIVDMDLDIFYISAKDSKDTDKVFERAAYLGYHNLQDNHDTMMTFDRVDISEPLDNRNAKGYFGNCC